MHIICIKSVWHLDMLWMDLWVHPYTETASMQLGENFWNVCPKRRRFLECEDLTRGFRCREEAGK